LSGATRGSRVIKEVDLSLVGRHQSPLLDPKPPILADIVLPVLDDIIARGDEAILIQFPKAWRQQRSNYFCEFVVRYNRLLQNHGGILCNGCDDLSSSEWVKTYGKVFGVINACYECLSHFCFDCRFDQSSNLEFCSKCERFYCSECSKIDVCNTCDKYFCHDCTSFGQCYGHGCEENNYCGDCQLKCEKCNGISCTDCCQVRCKDNHFAGLNDCTTCKRTLCYDCNDLPGCEMCKITFCSDCNDREGADGVAYCEECDILLAKDLCIGCRYKNFKTNGSKCTGCYDIITAAFNQATECHQKVESSRRQKYSF
jgi:hypothetical protein